MASFACRGVVEGFYGPPWPARDRIEVLTFCAARGMNAYVYAPKDDPRHRARWREPYDATEREHFADLGGELAALGMTFGFALSPGLDMDLHSADDRDALLAKFLAAVDDGARWLVVAFDDLPGHHPDGRGQAGTVAWLADQLWLRAPGVRISMVPTEYAGTASSPYLDALADGLPREVDVAWTGRWVVSPTITAADARGRAEALGGRAPLVWDNYPVNDGGMRRSLFLGPYQGREAELADACAGVLLNPMAHPHASKVALATGATFLADPAGYDPAAAWAQAIADVGGPDAGTLLVLAQACADSALLHPRDTPFHLLIDRLERGEASVEEVAAALAAARDALSQVRHLDAPLWQEAAAWLDQLHVEARAGLAALRLLLAIERDDPDDASDAAEGVQAAWARARTAGARNVFGPRFVCYPAATAEPGGARMVDLSRGVVEDQSAIDRLCRLAVAAHQVWVADRARVAG